MLVSEETADSSRPSTTVPARPTPAPPSSPPRRSAAVVASSSTASFSPLFGSGRSKTSSAQHAQGRGLRRWSGPLTAMPTTWDPVPLQPGPGAEDGDQILFLFTVLDCSWDSSVGGWFLWWLSSISNSPLVSCMMSSAM
ncbi:unnamed protein product [Urochloa humidicola]